VDSDPYALAHSGDGMDGYISTFTISPTSTANAPTCLTASVNSDVQIVLQWTASTTLVTGSLISMSVQRDDGNGMTTIATTSNTSPPYTDTTVVTSQTYDYQVASVNEGGVGAYSNIVTVTATSTASTTTSGGYGGKSNCDSNGFENNNSLRVYQVTYNIKTYEVQAYSPCGSVSAKMITPMQQSVLRLSLEPILLVDDIAIYSGFLDESEEKFKIAIQNKRHSFDETFYIHDKSIIKKYTGDTGYASEQQGTALPTVTSEQVTLSSVAMKSQSVQQIIPVENKKQIVDEKLVVEQIQYTPETIAEETIAEETIAEETIAEETIAEETIAEETMETTCGVGTKLVNGICKIIIPDETKFCFLFWCW